MTQKNAWKLRRFTIAYLATVVLVLSVVTNPIHHHWPEWLSWLDSLIFG